MEAPVKKGVNVIPVFDLLHTKVKLTECAPDIEEGQDPVDMARQVSLGGADEVAFIDVDIPRLGFKIWKGIISKLKEAVDIPVWFGYSMNTYEDFEVILNTGVDRVVIDVIGNTDQSIIDRLSWTFNKERIVVAVGGVKNPPESGRPEIELVHHLDKMPTGMNLIDWLKMAEYFGAGTILLSSYDTIGTGKGFDIEMIKAVTSAISVPVIAYGGAGELEHFYEVVKETGVRGVAATSVFTSGKFRPSEIKEYLESKKIEVAR
jgi:cyclase